MTEKVYVLHHVHDLGDSEDVKLLGIFSSEKRATEAIERFRRLSGFSDHPDGFSIDSYELDHDEWPDGFVAV